MGGRFGVGLLLCALGVARADFAGRVVGLDGRPVAGATVLLSPRSADGTERSVVTKLTDAAGGFSLASTEREVSIWAFKGELTTDLAWSAAGRKLDLVLRPGRRVRGQVLTLDGQPAPGARVGVAWAGGAALKIMSSPRTAESDAQGWFELAVLPVCSSLMLVAQKGDLITYPRQLRPDAWSPVLLLVRKDRLMPAKPAPKHLKVTVMAGDQPAPNVQVRMRRAGSNRESWQLHDWLVGDADLRPGDWVVGVEDWGLPDGWVVGPDRRVTIMAEGVVEVTLDLQRAATVVGRVTRLNGQPGAKVSVTATVNGRRFWSQSDADGRYRLHVPPGPVMVKCVDRTARVEAVLPPAEPTQIDFSVKLPEPVRVQIVLPDGRPAAGANVYLDEVGEVTTDAEGRFVHESGERCARPEMSVTWRDEQGQVWAGHASGSTLDEGEEAPPFRLVLAKDDQATLRGRVRGTDGQPVAGALVGLLLGNDVGHDHMFEQLRVDDWTTTDAQGAYEFDDGSRSEGWRQYAVRRVMVLKAGYRATGATTVSGKAPARAATDAVMEPLDGRLAGQVVDPQGQPVAGAQLLLEDCPPRPEQTTRADGTFDLAMAPRSGEQTLLALDGDRRVARARVHGGQTDLRLVLAEAAPPTAETRQAAAVRAVDRLHELMGGEYEWRVATDTLAVASGIDAKRGLAWLAEIDDVVLRRRVLAECLPALATTDPQAALDQMIEAERVDAWPRRAQAIGGLVANLPEPLAPAARQALARTLAGRPGEWGEGDVKAWLWLIPAMARVGHDATRRAIGNWQNEASNEDADLVRRLWRRPDVAMALVSSSQRPDDHTTYVGHNVAAMSGCLARLARRDPRLALTWWRQLKLNLDGDGSAPRDVEELAERLGAVDIDTAMDIAGDVEIAQMPDGGLRGRMLLAMPDRAEAARRLHEALGHLAPTGGMVHAAAVLDPPAAVTWMTMLRATGLRTEDCADLAACAPNRARVHLEWLTARLASLPRLRGERCEPDYEQPVALEETLHAELLRTWCVVDPDRAVALADAPSIGVSDRQERLLFVARQLSGQVP